MAQKEFGDALQWAQHYGMSADPVRQAQWADAGVTKHSIQDYLSRILDTAWVLRECCTRVPEEAEPLRLLLQYGVAKVTKEIDHLALRRAAEGGGGASTAADGGEADGALSEEALHAAKERLGRYQGRLETSVALCEEENEEGEDEPYYPEAFIALRDASLQDEAQRLAAAARFGAVRVLLERHGAELGNTRLAALEEVPETAEPIRIPSIPNLMPIQSLTQALTSPTNHTLIQSLTLAPNQAPETTEPLEYAALLQVLRDEVDLHRSLLHLVSISYSVPSISPSRPWPRKSTQLPTRRRLWRHPRSCGALSWRAGSRAARGRWTSGAVTWTMRWRCCISGQSGACRHNHRADFDRVHPAPN